ncbi:hypothetical protein M076_4672 [Bacteroides fragilis str. 2-F-2 |uniref:Uncharacterized protein n=1 Tax=Bacteroides fragilis str. 2-F-2 \|nr:hypothetical protein M076_4672 [Bacteroides fragilis str. 2-F-2 \
MFSMPLQIFFCKGISAIANVKHRAENLPQTGFERIFSFP